MKRRPQPGQQDLFGDATPPEASSTPPVSAHHQPQPQLPSCPHSPSAEPPQPPRLPLAAATAPPGAASSLSAQRFIVDTPATHPVDPDDPAQALADGWAQQAQRWARGQGADETTARHAGQAARALSLATTEGHVCLSLDALRSSVADGPTDWRRSLLASGIVGTPAAPGACPLLLDDEDRLYLQRDFQLERRLATRIARALAAAPQPLPAGISPAARDGAIDAAAVAAAMALRGRLTIVSGGPGTGKTTAVVRLLGLLLAEQPGIRIALAAPTGKAAARMAEAIRQRAADLPPALRALLPTGASTLHRLLGVSPATRGGPGEGFTHHAGRPLPIDVLVIDEASMLDLALATRVFEAVPPEARIVLLGDQDQLAAVESGAVFAELSADPGLSPACLAELADACAVPATDLLPPPPRQATGLRDAVVWFTRNHRFAPDSGIGRLAREINAGDAARTLAWLGKQTSAPSSGQLSEQAGEPSIDRRADPRHAQAFAPSSGQSVQWLPDSGEQLASATAARLVEPYAAYLDTVRAHLQGQADAAEVLRSFDHYRLLCALRAGPRGVDAWNLHIDRWARTRLGPRIDTAPRSPWFPGRPVMVLRNDPVLRLFNGDIGIALPAPHGAGIVLWFADAEAGLRAVAPLRLPEHASAWAMTVHQSQGSEFQAIGVLLPAQASRVLSRELLYTAVTRARERVMLVGSAAVIGSAIATPTERQSGLASRLREATAALASVADQPASGRDAGPLDRPSGAAE